MKSPTLIEYKHKVMWPALALSCGIVVLFMSFWVFMDGWREVSKSFGFYYIPILLLTVLGGRWQLTKKLIKYLESASMDFKLQGFGKIEESMPIKSSPVFVDNLQKSPVS